jgi:hypothetical protein
MVGCVDGTHELKVISNGFWTRLLDIGSIALLQLNDDGVEAVVIGQDTEFLIVFILEETLATRPGLLSNFGSKLDFNNFSCMIGWLTGVTLIVPTAFVPVSYSLSSS